MIGEERALIKTPGKRHKGNGTKKETHTKWNQERGTKEMEPRKRQRKWNQERHTKEMKPSKRHKGNGTNGNGRGCYFYKYFYFISFYALVELSFVLHFTSLLQNSGSRSQGPRDDGKKEAKET